MRSVTTLSTFLMIKPRHTDSGKSRDKINMPSGTSIYVQINTSGQLS